MGRQLFIGTRFRNFLIPDYFGSIEIEPALNLLVKGKLDFEKHLVLIAVLRGLHLIDIESTELSYQYKDNRNEDVGSLSQLSVAQENFLNRFEIEAQAASFKSGVLDGGVKQVLSRRPFFIEIHGKGRLIFPLLANLISSGFDNCVLATRSEVNATDINGGYLRRSDLGFDKNRRLNALKEEVSLYPEVLGAGGKPDLIIFIGSPPPELIQNWLELGIRQLFADYENSGELRIGPFVEPKNGACYNCLLIAESELGFPAFNRSLNSRLDMGDQKFPRNELASSLAAYGSSLLALEVLRIADSGSSNLHQRTMLISSLNYLEPQITSWERSPRCGCNWS